MWERLNQLIKPNGAVVLFGSEPFSSALRMSNIKNYKYDWIWNKNTSSPGLAKIRPMPAYENVLIFSSGKVNYFPIMEVGKPYSDNRNGVRNHNNEHKYGYKNRISSKNIGTRYPKNIINITKFNVKNQHPTQKPVALMEYLIKTYTNEGELVLDFTMGSGTTCVAAYNTGRKCIGIEMDDKYFEVAKQRVSDAINTKAAQLF
jgi:site-specific DNA-methyltransferase (adenine-specific)